MFEEIAAPAPSLVEESSPLPEAAAVPAAGPVPAAASIPVATLPDAAADDVPEETFGEAFAAFTRANQRKPDDASKQIDAAVVSLDAESVYFDIGYKTEGVMPRSAFPNNADEVLPGERMLVSSKGRNAEGYYDLSRIRVVQPTDWTALRQAFEDKTPVAGTLTAIVKGGATVDVGVRAFLPASRSGTRSAAELEALVGQSITCLITKLDTEDEDVVVDRRTIVEAEASALAATQFAALREGEIVTGQVRSLAAYGAFVDIGGLDGLLHVSDMAWGRVGAPGDVLEVGQQLRLMVLKVDAAGRRVSLGLKQLQAQPWDAAAGKYIAGERVTGTVTRLMDFGAFVELEPGIEGLIHVSEMSWVKKVRKPSDMLTAGDTVEAVILAVDPVEKRISLGLKQALGDPWADAATRFPVGSAIAGPVTQLMKFGAFVQLAEGIEGLVHVSEMVADRHVNHPSDVVRVGEQVQAQVLAIDAGKRQIKLSMKQLLPTGLSEYLEEHKAGDSVSGRVVALNGDTATIELGEGIRATCKVEAEAPATTTTGGGLDLSALTSMLKDKWKTGAPAAGSAHSAREPLAAGQVRSFRIEALDAEAKTIEVKLA